MSKQSPPAPSASAVGPCPTIIQISKMARNCKFAQHHRTTRPPAIHSLSTSVICRPDMNQILLIGYESANHPAIIYSIYIICTNTTCCNHLYQELIKKTLYPDHKFKMENKLLKQFPKSTHGKPDDSSV